MRKLLVIFFPLLMLVKIALADGILIAWGPNELSGMTKERFEDAKHWTKSEILHTLRSVDEWPNVYLLLVAAQPYAEDKNFIDSLIHYVSDVQETPLRLTNRLIIWQRITSDDILFEGKGIQIDDDLFKVGGRANWLLRNLTTKNYGYIEPTSTSDTQLQLQTKWFQWRKGKSVKQYKNPYETNIKGLNEIKSKVALQAIIHSLKNSPEKDQLIKNCLKNVYNLDELPTDPNSPAAFCSPDPYANMYLMKLTGVKENQTPEWWIKWWQTNCDQLVWNIETGMFDVKK